MYELYGLSEEEIGLRRGGKLKEYVLDDPLKDYKSSFAEAKFCHSLPEGETGIRYVQELLVMKI